MQKKRIEYIDAMRGFTMLLVVFSHILFFGYSGSEFNDFSLGGERFLSFNSLFIAFRMPLFFFISGFILFKKDFYWSPSESWKFTLKKAKIQLIPTIIFLLFYSYIWDKSFLDNLFSSAKAGYWFTITLFEFFIIYLCYRIICNLLKKVNGLDSALILLGIFLYCASLPTCLKILNIDGNKVVELFGIQNLKYFIFFAFGTLVKKHFEKVEKLMDNGYLSAIWIISFFCLSIYVLHHGYFQHTVLTHLYLIVNGILGLMLVFAFFRKYQSSFTQEKAIGRILQYIGRRTLDIYLLHYFFLPYNLGFIGDFFATNPNQTLEFVVSMFIAIIVVAICLLVSNILRISTVLANWLFGVKN